VISVPEIQKSIYYLTGEPLASINDSPFLEVLKKGTEVLLLVDPINEYAITQLKEFGAKKLTFMFAKRVSSLRRLKKRRRLAKRRLSGSKNSTRSLRMLLAKVEKVMKVIVSNRVADSPCAHVTGQFNWSADMERILKA
jgi:molecular chaperone HtpG